MEKDLYYVAVKIFLLDHNKRLLIIKDRFDQWDIPGGRLKREDFDLSLEDLAKRKISEELGDQIKYKLGNPIIYMRHERGESLPNGTKEKRRIFAVAYAAEYQGGDLHLGHNHTNLEWVEYDKFIPNKYFNGGWLRGVEEFKNKFWKKL